jgi:hypothetical protein
VLPPPHDAVHPELQVPSHTDLPSHVEVQPVLQAVLQVFFESQ